MEEKKICPFSSKPCMEKQCVLFDDIIWQCEFKGITDFIRDCFDDLIDSAGDDNDD